jgi:hypothetical protein
MVRSDMEFILPYRDKMKGCFIEMLEIMIEGYYMKVSMNESVNEKWRYWIVREDLVVYFIVVFLFYRCTCRN